MSNAAGLGKHGSGGIGGEAWPGEDERSPYGTLTGTSAATGGSPDCRAVLERRKKQVG